MLLVYGLHVFGTKLAISSVHLHATTKPVWTESSSRDVFFFIHFIFEYSFSLDHRIAVALAWLRVRFDIYKFQNWVEKLMEVEREKLKVIYGLKRATKSHTIYLTLNALLICVYRKSRGAKVNSVVVFFVFEMETIHWDEQNIMRDLLGLDLSEKKKNWSNFSSNFLFIIYFHHILPIKINIFPAKLYYYQFTVTERTLWKLKT